MPVSIETVLKEHGESLSEEHVERYRAGLKMLESSLNDIAASQYENLLRDMGENHPAAWAVRWNMASGLHYSYRFDEALKQYDIVLQTRPNLTGVWFERGNTLAGLGRMEDSVESLKRALELEPDNSMIQHHLGLALFDLGRRQEAISLLLAVSQSLEASARAGCLVRAAAVMLEQGQEDPARSYLADAWTALKEDSGDEWVRVGLTLQRAGRPEAAQPFLEQALKRTPCRQASEAAAHALGIKLEESWTFTPLGPAPRDYEELDSLVVDQDAYHAVFLTDKFLVLDGQQIPRDGSELENLSVNKQGRWAAAAHIKGKWYSVQDGNAVAGPFKSPVFPIWSSSGRLAVVTEDQVVIDGKAGPKFDGIMHLAWSPDGQRCAYLAGKGTQSHVVVDGNVHPGYAGVSRQFFCFSPDSSHFAYVAQDKDRQQTVVLDGQPGKWYQGCAGIVFSGNGQRMVHHAGKDGKSAPVLDRVEQGWFAKTGDYQLDFTGETLVCFSGPDDSASYLMVNGQKASADFADMYNVKVSPDGQHTACFGQRNNKWHVVLDGKESEAYEDVVSDTLAWNPARKSWHYCVRKGYGMHFVQGGKLSRPYDEFAKRPPEMSPGGKVAYGASRDGLWYVVLDGRESEGFERLLVGPGFRGETMHALVVRNGQLERLTA